MSRPERFLDRLTPEARAAAPVSYHLAQLGEAADAGSVRKAESGFYRATGFECRPFHKPISRVLPPEAPDKP
ncbi:MAG TPA: hypothetical protein VL025_13930 [Thermoanaerobaculia bacterium]|nr:hypothetical protein [Thermoanaerobaculia bacterium]